MGQGVGSKMGNLLNIAYSGKIENAITVLNFSELINFYNIQPVMINCIWCIINVVVLYVL